MYVWIEPDLVVDAGRVVAVVDGEAPGARTQLVTVDNRRIGTPLGKEAVARRLREGRLETNGVRRIG